MGHCAVTTPSKPYPRQTISNEDEQQMLEESFIIALKEWITAEPNLKEKTREIIESNINKTKQFTIEEWDELMRLEAAERLLKNRNENDTMSNQEMAERISRVIGPTLQYYLSNAPIHIIEMYLKKYVKHKKRIYG